MDSRLLFVVVCSFIIVLLRFLLAATFTYKLRILSIRFRRYMPILLILISPAVPCTIALALASTNQTEVAIRIGSLTLMCLLLADIVSRPQFDLQELTDVKQAVAEEWQRETSILVYFKRLVHASLLILGGIVTTLLDRQVPSAHSAQQSC